MGLDLRDFKRLLSIASGLSAILSICYMKGTSSNANADLITLMFLLSNLLTIAGLKLRDSFNKKIGRIFIYIFSLSGVVLLFDCAFNYTEFLSKNLYKVLCILLIVSMTAFFIRIYAFSKSDEEIQEEIKKSISEVSKTFEETVEEFTKQIDEMGGWKEFVNTAMGRQMAREIKKYSTPKTPRDHKRKGKRK
ncbi:hypothetical protein LTY36_01150 [Limosilactobacillus agrestis]|uniref:Uncharacterized protein n=1 Tax=Limosilactobacillus agrestis TaxID=2759748 RepID=A0A7W3UHR9_9LACO|nr:hypothetical protein [Limosilactobacillus agrestis]MBB1095180.1 hypothetical protein [Limosilactobacillus agrestis]MCD7129829.1 hypothetical protein [Limosilactobacillus agrestis]